MYSPSYAADEVVYIRYSHQCCCRAAHGHCHYQFHSQPRVAILFGTLGTSYLPPDQRKMSGPRLDVLYDTNKDKMIKNPLLESIIFGVTVFGDGATITNVPLINNLATSPNNLFALLEIVDCTDQMTKGGKKDMQYLLSIVRSLVRWLKAMVKLNIVDLIIFDGASNAQLAAKIVARYHPPITVCHGTEHVVSLFFANIYNKI